MNEEEEKPKVVIHVEALIRHNSSESLDYLESAIKNHLETNISAYQNGEVDITQNEYLLQNLDGLWIRDLYGDTSYQVSIPFWQAELNVHLFSLNTEGSVAESLEGAGDITAYHEWMLPCTEFHHLWEHLVYDHDIKRDLINYATTAFYFSQQHVNPTIISLNRVLLLHGPPGTGKTSICRALAQKLAIRYFSHYQHIALIEINSHSLFSKWFSESGKLVMKLFDYIHDLLSNENTMLFILIDEVESLSVSRKAAMSGTEPSDGMRVVNALLTQIDKLKNNPNVMILTTSNLSESIDTAFVDRADIKRYIGNPGKAARYWILCDCLEELCHRSVIQAWGEPFPPYEDFMNMSRQDGSIFALLGECVSESEGLSGRALRKLPFQAFMEWLYGRMTSVSLREYLMALKKTIQINREWLEDILQNDAHPN